MQIGQEFAVNQYQAIQPSTPVTAPKTGEVKSGSKAAEDTVSVVKPDTDRVELSKDAKDVTKMSAGERASLVENLKSDLANQMSRFTNMMVQTFQKQGFTASTAQGDDFWRMMASGNYTVDAKTKAEAQEAISEDGYWGVKQTSQRIFDFASALAGDDPDKMKTYQAAVEKGFKQAGEAWGGDLPEISGQTHDAVNKLFDEYYASKGVAAAS